MKYNYMCILESFPFYLSLNKTVTVFGPSIWFYVCVASIFVLIAGVVTWLFIRRHGYFRHEKPDKREENMFVRGESKIAFAIIIGSIIIGIFISVSIYEGFQNLAEVIQSKTF